MAWGDFFASAWNGATDSAKAAASKAADTAQGAYAYTKERAVQAANDTQDKAAQAYDYGKEKTLQAAAYTKQKALEGYAYAKDSARDAQRNALDSAFDSAAEKAENVRQTYNQAATLASQAYAAVKSALGLNTAGSPTVSCPSAKLAHPGLPNKSLDGWVISPQGPGKDCIAVRPGNEAVAKSRAWARVSESDCCKQRRTGAAPRDIIYVNGVTTGSKKHCETLNAIAAQTCGRVVGIYNATNGFIADGAQTGQDRRLIKSAAAGKPLPGRDGRNAAVDTLSRTLADEVEAGRTPEVWAHSQGGAVTSLALYEAKNDLGVTTGSRNALSKVKVKTFGSAAPQWPGGPAYEHYVHVNDPVPTMFGLGHKSANDLRLSGRNAKVIRFGGDVESADAFKSADPSMEWLPVNLDNHAVDASYLRMEKQQNGGCP
jgi:hypothetical protein